MSASVVIRIILKQDQQGVVKDRTEHVIV